MVSVVWMSDVGIDAGLAVCAKTGGKFCRLKLAYAEPVMGSCQLEVF